MQDSNFLEVTGTLFCFNEGMSSAQEWRRQQIDKIYREALSLGPPSVSTAARYQEIVRFVGDDRSARVLDIGCGLGHVLRLLKARGFQHLTALDRSRIVVEFLRSEGIQVIVGDIENLDLDQVGIDYDYVIMGDILEHLFAPKLALDVVERILSRDGRLVVSVPNAGWLPVSLFQTFYPKLSPLTPAFMTWTHTQQFTLYSLGLLLKPCGFDFEVIRGVPFEFVSYFSRRAFRPMLGNALLKVMFGISDLLCRRVPTVFSPYLVVKARKTDCKPQSDYWDHQ